MKTIDQEKVVGAIHMLKLEKGIFDDDVAESIGISRVTLAKRKKSGGWYGSELAVIADMCGCSVDDFVMEVPDA